jgi:putative transposase
MILELLEEAVAGGAREEQACDVLGIEVRTVQRWRAEGVGEDQRRGPHTKPGNALTSDERAKVLALANSPEHRDMSPKQLVPKLADEGVYVASESSFYRILHAAMQMAHRGRARAPQQREVPTHVAYGPNEVWVWDITYLPTVMRGVFFYLYLILDLFSRKVVGWAVYEVESMDLSSELLDASIKAEGANPKELVVHADNGGPMKGSTMLAKMQLLGVLPSFSRPGVSDDNAFAEAMFRHLKYTPSWPKKPFATLELARSWVATFVAWYNTTHRHSGIQFLTPAARHAGMDDQILTARKAVYEQAKERHPERWSGETRDCRPVKEVGLTPTGQATAAKNKAPSGDATRPAEAPRNARKGRPLSPSPAEPADPARRGQGSPIAAPATRPRPASSGSMALGVLEPPRPSARSRVTARQGAPRRSPGRGKLSPCGKSRDSANDEREAGRLRTRRLIARMTSRAPLPTSRPGPRDVGAPALTIRNTKTPETTARSETSCRVASRAPQAPLCKVLDVAASATHSRAGAAASSSAPPIHQRATRRLGGAAPPGGPLAGTRAGRCVQETLPCQAKRSAQTGVRIRSRPGDNNLDTHRLRSVP